MNIRIVKIDLEKIEYQLMRLNDLLEQLVISTNPPPSSLAPREDDPRATVFYTDEEQEIVAHKLAQMGRRYKPKD